MNSGQRRVFPLTEREAPEEAKSEASDVAQALGGKLVHRVRRTVPVEVGWPVVEVDEVDSRDAQILEGPMVVEHLQLVAAEISEKAHALRAGEGRVDKGLVVSGGEFHGEAGVSDHIQQNHRVAALELSGGGPILGQAAASVEAVRLGILHKALLAVEEDEAQGKRRLGARGLDAFDHGQKEPYAGGPVVRADKADGGKLFRVVMGSDDREAFRNARNLRHDVPELQAPLASVLFETELPDVLRPRCASLLHDPSRLRRAGLASGDPWSEGDVLRGEGEGGLSVDGRSLRGGSARRAGGEKKS